MIESIAYIVVTLIYCISSYFQMRHNKLQKEVIESQSKYMDSISAHNTLLNIQNLKMLYNTYIDTEQYENAQIVKEWITHTQNDTVTSEFINKLKNTILKQ